MVLRNMEHETTWTFTYGYVLVCLFVSVCVCLREHVNMGERLSVRCNSASATTMQADSPSIRIMSDCIKP